MKLHHRGTSAQLPNEEISSITTILSCFLQHFFFEFKVLKEEIHKQLTKLVMVKMFSHRVVVKIKQENAPVFGCRDILGILET